jgi:hypothetical protein
MESSYGASGGEAAFKQSGHDIKRGQGLSRHKRHRFRTGTHDSTAREKPRMNFEVTNGCTIKPAIPNFSSTLSHMLVTIYRLRHAINASSSRSLARGSLSLLSYSSANVLTGSFRNAETTMTTGSASAAGFSSHGRQWTICRWARSTATPATCTRLTENQTSLAGS